MHDAIEELFVKSRIMAFGDGFVLLFFVSLALYDIMDSSKLILGVSPKFYYARNHVQS